MPCSQRRCWSTSRSTPSWAGGEPTRPPATCVPPLDHLNREGMTMTIVEPPRPITGGVDTHLDSHVAAALDANGGVLGVESFATTTAGFVELHRWLARFGSISRVGVEGTGAY